MSELKPCAHCGGEAEITTTDLIDLYSNYDQVSCKRCGISVPLWRNGNKVGVAEWNRRASPWIRFEDRKPEEGQHVFLARLIGGEMLWAWPVKWAMPDYQVSTHWMPIPPLEDNNA